MTDDTDTTDRSGASPGDGSTDGDGPAHADGSADTDATAATDSDADVATNSDATAEADGGHGTGTGPDGPSEGATDDGGNRAVREYLLKGALVMLVVLGVVTTLQFYIHAQTAIGRLVSTDYRPLFLAGFNLAVLLTVGVGIAQVVRRLG